MRKATAHRESVTQAVAATLRLFCLGEEIVMNKQQMGMAIVGLVIFINAGMIALIVALWGMC
jgi:hypothetical protein